MRYSAGEKVYYALNSIFMSVVALLCVLPMIHILAISFSTNQMVVSGKVTFWPQMPTLEAYRYLLENKLFQEGMLNSFLRVILGVSINLILTILSAYPLSKEPRRFKMRSVYAWYFFIPMIFGGGLIPSFILVNELKLIDSIWALVLPGAVPTFFVLLLLNFYRGLPGEIEEAALIDGASQWTILFKLIVPTSLPALATIAVYSILGHWNSWFDGYIYMSDPNHYPLMTYMQVAVLQIDLSKLTPEEIEKLSVLGNRTYKASQIFLGSMPMFIAYPFFQKYFTKGLVLGSVKG